MPLSDMKIKGYKVTESNEVGRTGVFKVRITRTSMVSSQSHWMNIQLKLLKMVLNIG